MARDDKKASDETASASAPAAVSPPKSAGASVQEAALVAAKPAPSPKTVEAPAENEPARAPVAPPPPAAPAPAKQSFKVWAHGTLQRNGTTHKPGDVLSLTPEEAAKIPCLEPAT